MMLAPVAAMSKARMIQSLGPTVFSSKTCHLVLLTYSLTHSLTHSLHCARYLKSCSACQKISLLLMEPEG